MADEELQHMDDDEGKLLRCRFYENQYPEPEELVMANVTDIGEMGAYVKLLEYDDIDVNCLESNYVIRLNCHFTII